MDVYIERLMTPHSFLSFEIGAKLNLSAFTIEVDYNPIGTEGSAYYFFNKEIDFEVNEKNGVVDSFDILMQNQENELYLGDKEGNFFRLSKCRFATFISYLNKINLAWKFEKILSDKSISIAYYSMLKILFHFDCEGESSLSLIQVTKG